jgi:transcriptional regulator with XRE-family HTH domain
VTEVNGFAVGARIKAARLAQGLSQRELARRANITNANLSMIEQEKVSPALTTIEKILAALGVDLQRFFSDSFPMLPVCKAADFVSIKRKGVEFKVLPAMTENLMPRYLATATLLPSTKLEEFWLSGDGSVAGWVQSGQVELTLNQTQYDLSVGDGFEFPLRALTQLVNSSPHIASLIIRIDIQV